MTFEELCSHALVKSVREGVIVTNEDLPDKPRFWAFPDGSMVRRRMVRHDPPSILLWFGYERIGGENSLATEFIESELTRIKELRTLISSPSS